MKIYFTDAKNLITISDVSDVTEKNKIDNKRIYKYNWIAIYHIIHVFFFNLNLDFDA